MENTFGTGRSLNVERTTFRAGWANVLLHACMLIQFVIEGTVMNIATCPSMELNLQKKKFVSFPKAEATMAFAVLESPSVMMSKNCACDWVTKKGQPLRGWVRP